MPKIQTAQSHTARDPLFHFVLMPIFLANFIVTIVAAVRDWPVKPGAHVWSIVVAAGLFLVTVKIRMYGLKIQDRVIRAEERLRIAALVPAADLARLSTQQLIALRFASDGELPGLVYKTIAEGLDAKSIKNSIVVWRPDHARI